MAIPLVAFLEPSSFNTMLDIFNIGILMLNEVEAKRAALHPLEALAGKRISFPPTWRHNINSEIPDKLIKSL